ncbi:efflux RND transporter permease subunit [Aquisalimonas asiatica]|uniref:Hydrophobic/amphiphilic exporter-1, HAE1 family n=1 Tax=Aquisalimonas asiatica TaxID=406100 RepID=A0A1H8TFG0_9GAMM|nr:efflux RND transporter permease subunit [Aquisalimonas asiatica]SEO89621.1 hydrophobic/amphiphilic exporter-1, HAE1 family [Aquisalimonas asiatica]
MTLPELSIRRHVLAVMISAVLVLFGYIGYQEVGTDRIPNIDFPVVNVVVAQPGADPGIIDASITSEVERAVNTVPGIDYIQSSSSPGTSIVTVTFDLDVDIDVAFNEVQAKINEIRDQLPDDAEDPIVQKVETDAQAIMWLSVQGDRTLQQLGTYARNVVRPQIENINGVGEIQIGGGLERNIRIEVEPDRLAAYGLTVTDLVNAIEMEHFQLPGGFLVAERTERLLKLDMEYNQPEALEELIVASQDGALIRLSDVAEIVDGLEDPRALARFNGEPTVGLGVVKVSGTNTVAIIDEVKERLETEIRPQLPPGMEVNISSDQSVFILEMIDTLYQTIGLGILFAAFVLWLFLKNLRSTLIVTLSIPVALAAVIATIFAFGYTLNSLTMLAMLLLIGVVVDDAIVVLENIFRHREEGIEDPVEGAIVGSNEVFFAIIATTLSLISIFLPVLFMEGIIGRFFESFAVVVAMGVLASSIVALTLTPMLCSRFLSVPKEHGKVYNVLERAFRGMESGYRWLLAKVLRFRWITLGIVVVVTVAAGSLLGQLGGEFAPEEDEGQFLVSIQTPLGSSIDYTDEKLQAVEEVLGNQEGIYSYFTAIGLGDQGQVNDGISFVRLDPRDERELSQQEITAQVQGELAKISGVQAFASSVPLIGGQRGEPLQFNISGPELDEVADLARELEGRLRSMDEIDTLDLELDLDQPELVLNVDRERARTLGITTFDVTRAANVLAGGIDVARYNDDPGDGERYDVRLKAREGALQTPEDLSKLYLRSDNGDMIRLDTLADFEPAQGPSVIGRYELQYAAQFYSNPSVPLAEAVDLVESEAEEIMPLGYSLNLVGEAEEFERTAAAILFVFVVAILLVYMVLGSQFNSFLQPFIILAALPLAMIGGIVGLWLFGHTLNIYSMIGLVLLVGLVTKNGILLVDLTNQYRVKQGMTVDEALAAACPIRLRPILMTSLTLILAMLPAAIGAGAGAETQGPLAVAIISGMISSMLLTLAVIPAAYSLLENAAERVQERRAQRHA